MGRQTSRANNVQGRQNEAHKKFTRVKKTVTSKIAASAVADVI